MYPTPAEEAPSLTQCAVVPFSPRICRLQTLPHHLDGEKEGGGTRKPWIPEEGAGRPGPGIGEERGARLKVSLLEASHGCPFSQQSPSPHPALFFEDTSW